MRHELMEGWSFDSKMTSCKYNGSSVVQGQIGQNTVEIMLKDFVKTCTKKVVLVNDMVAGIGETALAALGARLSDEACESGVRCASAIGGLSIAKVCWRWHRPGSRRRLVWHTFLASCKFQA